jgi:amino-acid N-acetyltransferase
MSTTSDPSIRQGRQADLEVALPLLASAGLPTADLADAQELTMWVLEIAGALVGVIALERFGSEGLLRSLAVAPEFRNRGFGRELVTRLEKDARDHGIQRLVLLTETAEQFFRTIGYSRIERAQVSGPLQQSAEFRTLCQVSAACMTKAIAVPRAE